MLKRSLRTASTLACAALFSACSGGGAPTLPNTPAPTAAPVAGTLNVGPYVGHFTEYTLPAGQDTPGDLIVGPDGAVWFTTHTAIDRITGTGSITPFSAPQFVDAVFFGIASLDNALWYGVDRFPPDLQPEQFLVRQRTSGAPAITGDLAADTFTPHMTVGPDHRLWAATVGELVSSVQAFGPDGQIAHDVDLPFNYDPQGITAGPDRKIYATGFGDLANPDSAVFQISTGGTILHQFNLPEGSIPNGITAGPDGALWIALSGSNSIGRLTTSGSFTQFPIPTANAMPFEITKGSDGALWFTEQQANAIGRISVSGSITEYPVPTFDAKPFGITTCPRQCENAHGRLWFTEQNANKVGKFEF